MLLTTANKQTNKQKTHLAFFVINRSDSLFDFLPHSLFLHLFKDTSAAEKINPQMLNVLQSFCWHLQIVVLFGFWQLGEIHQARMLPLIIIPYLWEKKNSHRNNTSAFPLLPATLVCSSSYVYVRHVGKFTKYIYVWNTQPCKSVSLWTNKEGNVVSVQAATGCIDKTVYSSEHVMKEEQGSMFSWGR